MIISQSKFRLDFYKQIFKLNISISSSDSTQNGNNQDVLKIEVFHGKLTKRQKLKSTITFSFLFFAKVPIDMYLFYVVQIIYVLLI